MRLTFVISIFSVLLSAACVDRLSYNIDKGVNFEITIDGSISDEPGPYEVRIYNVFDIESKETRKTPVSVRSVVISDDKGNAETLNPIDAGIYQTSPTGIQGTTGGVYKLRVELFDGRIYESLPDTILASAGSIDSLYLKFNKAYNEIGVLEYSFDVLFNASYNEKINNHVLWKFTGTFQAETHPELHPVPPSPRAECFWLQEIARCNYLPPCSGYRNVGSDFEPKFEKKYDCTCCTCWYNIFNPTPILSDDHFTAGGKINGLKAGTIPLSPWTLEHKIRVDVSQMNLSKNTYRFWKAIRDQEKATGNLFQPVSGKVPSNFVQISGKTIPVEGLFFATSIKRQVKYLERLNLPPNFTFAIPFDVPIYPDDCRKRFPNSTNSKPALWTN